MSVSSTEGPMNRPIDYTDSTVTAKIFKYAILVMAIFFFVGCDQLAKEFARRELSYATVPIHMLGMVRFEYAENTGSFLSIGSGLPQDLRRSIHIVSALVVVIGFGLLFAYSYQLDRMRLLGYSLLLAGACGNLVDRFVNDGRVIDFIVLRIGGMQTGVFNLADVFIMTGLALVLARFGGKQRLPS